MKILVVPKAIIVLAAFVYTVWFAANAIGYLFFGGIEGGLAFINQRVGESNRWVPSTLKVIPMEPTTCITVCTVVI